MSSSSALLWLKALFFLWRHHQAKRLSEHGLIIYEPLWEWGGGGVRTRDSNKAYFIAAVWQAPKYNSDRKADRQPDGIRAGYLSRIRRSGSGGAAQEEPQPEPQDREQPRLTRDHSSQGPRAREFWFHIWRRFDSKWWWWWGVYDEDSAWGRCAWVSVCVRAEVFPAGPHMEAEIHLILCADHVQVSDFTARAPCFHLMKECSLTCVWLKIFCFNNNLVANLCRFTSKCVF